jgi:hypothetical protein
MVWARIAPFKSASGDQRGPLLKKLFLSHFNGDAGEVHILAELLRIRGIVPWVDKQGGFHFGDHNATEARRAIKEDCFGLLLYATPTAFKRPFITGIELPVAIEQHQTDPSFQLFSVPRDLSFQQLTDESIKTLGYNLADQHSIPVEGADPKPSLTNVAREVLEKVVCRLQCKRPDKVHLQFSTRELMPISDNEILTIDGRSIYKSDRLVSWCDLIQSLQEVKSNISHTFGRPQIVVEGSKHISSAFLFGRVFQRFPLIIRQTPTDYWSSHGSTLIPELNIREHLTNAHSLIVTVASGHKDLSHAAIEAVNQSDASMVSITPRSGALTLNAESSRGLAEVIYHELDRIVAEVKPSHLHLFMALPQATAMTLGQKFAGMPLTYVYDWSGKEYETGKMIPGGVL